MGIYREEYTFNFFSDDSQKIKVKTQKLIKKMMGLIAEADYEEVGILLEECKSMRYSIQGYIEESTVPDMEKSLLTDAGYTTALMDVMQMYQKSVSADNDILKIKTGYRDKLLSILEKRGTMLHKDLACELGVSPSGLTAVISHMNATATKLICVEEISKYKIYSLTPVAHRYILKRMADIKETKVKLSIPKPMFIYDSEYTEMFKWDNSFEVEKKNQDKKEMQRMVKQPSQKYSEKDLGYERVLSLATRCRQWA